MIKKPSSIFNEVLGPIMVGPSSSHTAGPGRIGRVANMLLGEEAKEIEIIFDEKGSYAATYIAQGSNYGFIGGILGMDISDEKIKESLDIAKEKNIKVEFRIEDIGGDIHPNFAAINLQGTNENKIRIETASTGGGAFEINKYEEFPISIKGDCYDTLIISENKESMNEIKLLLKEVTYSIHSHIEKSNTKDRYLFTIKSDVKIDEELINKLKEVQGILFIKSIMPVLPIVKKSICNPPFVNATEALDYSKSTNLPLWELACEYEEAISGKSRQEIMDMAIHVVHIMRRSALKGIEGNFEKRGFLTSKAGTIDKNMKKENAKLIDMGLLNQVMVWATAAMEYDICRGTIVAAPTGGSCGVIPGAVVSVGEQLGLPEEEIAKGVLVAGLVGVFIDHLATFSAEMGGCQAENGSGSSMAAAGVVHLLGGNVKEAFDAASLAMANLMGLICDPIAGVGNVPCVSRNPMAALNAVLSANMVLNGFDAFIPLDETLVAMKDVGLLMPREFRCTGLGGLCTTPTAKKVTETLVL